MRNPSTGPDTPIAIGVGIPMRRDSGRSRSLAAVLRPWRRRFWLQSGVTWALRGLVAGLAAACLVLLVSRFMPWEDARWWAGGVALAGLLTGLIYALVRLPSMPWTAGRVDRLLGLADRQATAWEMRDTEGIFADLQRTDALVSLRGRSTSVISLRPGLRPLGAVVAAIAAVALLVLLPNPMDRVIAERQEFQEQLAEAKEELQQAREELAKPDSRLSAEEREALEEALTALEERLAEAKDKPEALAALSETEQALQQLSEPGQSQALQEVASALDGAPAGEQVAEALQSGDSEALAQALDALMEQAESLNSQEQAALMAALQQAANAAGGVEGLPGALRGAAGALGAGDAGAMEAALGDLESLLAQLQEGAATEQAIASLQSSIEGARASVSGVAVRGQGSGVGGQGTNSGAGSGEGEGSGEGSGEGGEGEGQGTGEGSGSGTGSGSGSGSGGEGSGSSGTGVGQGGGQGGNGAGDAPGARQGEATGRLGANGETVFIPSQGQGSLPGMSIGSSSGTVPGELLPYDEVIGSYAAQARDHIERNPVPEGYKDLVRRYFAELEE